MYKKLLCIIFIFSILFLTSCTNQEKAPNNNQSQKENISSADLNSSSFEEKQYKAYYDEGIKLADNFDTIYSLCKDALLEYYNARNDHTDVNFDKYIENKNLKEYLKIRLEAEKSEYTFSNLSNFGIAKIDWNFESDDKDDFVYINLCASRVGTSGGGPSCEMLVQNINGEFKIVDWYCDGKDFFDEKVRGHNQKINNPSFWKDDNNAISLIQKAKEIDKKTITMR